MTDRRPVASTSRIGFGIGLALGLAAVASVYAAVAPTFSSTIVVVKRACDRRAIGSLRGRIALGLHPMAACREPIE